jgi:membrane protein implicated in regulation of membrane protease activity
MGQNLIGQVGLVTTTIPAGGIGEVRLAVAGGTTYPAYGSNRGVPIPRGTRVTVTEHYPPRTLVVTADA